MEKEARTPITEEICRKLELMMKGGADGTEAARLVGISQSRASRIKKAGFNYAKYRENDVKEREEQRRRAEKEQEPAEEPIEGQIRMEIPERPGTETAEDVCAEYPERVKLMRFMAGQVERIVKELLYNGNRIEEQLVLMNTRIDKLNDTMSMVLRAVRKE